MRRLAPFLIASLFATGAAAAPILAPPGDPAHDAPLAKLIHGYQRQQDTFATAELGLSINPFIKPESMTLVRDFFAQDAQPDFAKFSGKHPFEVVERFNEHEDLGNFGGVASVGVAARFLELKKRGAPAAEIAAARLAVERAARAWIVYGSIGGPGVVARGIRRVTPIDGAKIPGPLPELVPLKDAMGNALPAKKTPVWRAPVAKGFDDYIWIDDTSKDQVIGYALATVWLWDALKSDEMAPAGLADALAKPLLDFARALMKTAPERDLDMCARDADGRLTTFGDLEARSISATGAPLPEETPLRNGFNAALGAAIIRAAYHVSGRNDVGEFYYGELIGRRDYPAHIAKNAGAIFVGAKTNFSNVNMLAMALALLGRIETDAGVRARLSETLDKQFWDTGNDRDVSHVKQAWFDAVYGAYGPKPPSDLRARVTENLSGFQPAPAIQRARINCDDAEIAAGSCLAIDGKTTLTLSTTRGHNDIVVSRTLLPMSIRPDSDFAWRGDPYGVNLGGDTRMNPGGDVLAAYWLARASDVDDPDRNLSSFARAPLPYTKPSDDAGATEADAGTDAGASPSESAKSGCGCALASRDSSLGAITAALMLLVVARRRGQ